jgi:hypothetical protein
MDTTEYQRALLSFYTSRIELATPPMLHPVRFRPGDGIAAFETLVLRAPLAMERGQPSLFLHATLADSRRELGASTRHEHQFVGIYESDAEDLSGLVAAARHFDATSAPLDHGHTCPLEEDDDSALRRRGYSHVSLVGVDVFGSMIASLNDARDAMVGATPTRFLAVLPLTRADWKLKIESGTEALLHAWEAQGRDVFTVRPGIA